MNCPRKKAQWQRNRNRSHEIKDQSLGIALCFSFQMVFFALCKEIFELLVGGVPEHVGKISIKQVFFFGEMRWKMYLCGKQIKNALR